MKLKSRPQDFKVTELLAPDLLQDRGEHRVYRVTKRKLTSIEAARELAHELDLPPGAIAMAGLKDRQGVTTQYMSAERGAPLHVRREGLVIEDVGRIARPLTSEDSLGNAFQIIARDLGPRELGRMRKSLEFVREHGLPNYFDDQRFGNLRHRQGWIYVELAGGRVEEGLRQLLTRVSPFDDARSRDFKSALYRHWGDWRACREIAGRFGAHHSLFEHLRREPHDFDSAFRHVSNRVRLIHLFAFQSHLWNRAVTRYLERACDRRKAFTLSIREGRLLFPKFEVPCESEWGGEFPLVGERLDGVVHEDQRRLYKRVLHDEGLVPERLSCRVPGFALKAEERPFVVVPRELRVRPAEADPLNEGRSLVKIQFELPRGSYATMVLRRLIGPLRDDDDRGSRGGGERGSRRGARGGGRRGGGARGFGGREGGRRGGGSKGGDGSRGYAGSRDQRGSRGSDDSNDFGDTRDHGGARDHGGVRGHGDSRGRGGRGGRGGSDGDRAFEGSDRSEAWAAPERGRGSRGSSGRGRGGGRGREDARDRDRDAGDRRESGSSGGARSDRRGIWPSEGGGPRGRARARRGRGGRGGRDDR